MLYKTKHRGTATREGYRLGEFSFSHDFYIAY